MCPSKQAATYWAGYGNLSPYSRLKSLPSMKIEAALSSSIHSQTPCSVFFSFPPKAIVRDGMVNGIGLLMADGPTL